MWQCTPGLLCMVVNQLHSSPKLAKNQALQMHFKKMLDEETLVYILQGQVGRPDREAATKLLQACDDDTSRQGQGGGNQQAQVLQFVQALVVLESEFSLEWTEV